MFDEEGVISWSMTFRINSYNQTIQPKGIIIPIQEIKTREIRVLN